MFHLPHRKRVDFENLLTRQANKILTYLGLFDQNKKSKILIHPPFHGVSWLHYKGSCHGPFNNSCRKGWKEVRQEYRSKSGYRKKMRRIEQSPYL
jgi:hypothetical protein